MYSGLTVDDDTGVGWCWIGASYFWEKLASFYGTFILLLLLSTGYLFLNMVALTVLYGSVVIYIQMQRRKFSRSISTFESRSTQRSTNTEAGQSSQVKGSLTTTMSERTTRSNSGGEANPVRRIHNVSLKLLLYPTVYVALTLPLSILRLCEFSGRSFNLKTIYVGASLWDLQGFCNVLLYTTTRKGIISWDSVKQWFMRRTSKPNQLSHFDSINSLNTTKAEESVDEKFDFPSSRHDQLRFAGTYTMAPCSYQQGKGSA
jgi:hypothetical protein